MRLVHLLVATLLAAGVVASGGPGPKAARAAELTVAALTDWPPFSGTDLPNRGFANDVTVTALERAGYDVAVTMMPWSRAFAQARAGVHDILPSVWYSDARAEDLAFTDPIARNRMVFVKRRGDPFTFDGLPDLAGKTVGIVRDYGYDSSFLESEAFSRVEADSLAANLRKVAGGELDLTVGDVLRVKHVIATEAPNLAGRLALTEDALSEADLFVTVSRKRPDHDDIVAAFNDAFESMRRDGTYAEIIARHHLD